MVTGRIRFPESDIPEEDVSSFDEIYTDEDVNDIIFGMYEDDDDDSMYYTKETILNKNMFIDFKKIKKISFKDPVIKELQFNSTACNALFQMDSHEAMLYSDSTWDYLRYKYTQIYGIFPDVIRVEGIKAKKVIIKLFELFKIDALAYNKTISKTNKDKTCLLTIILCIDDMILHFDGGDSIVLFYNKKHEANLKSNFYTLLGLMKNFKEPVVSKNKIYVVYRNQQGFAKVGFNVKKINLNLAENYNDEFKPISESIIKDLNNKDKTGLFILSGEPGTGKTSFIRFLTSKIKRNIIFISPDMVDQITDPSFIPFLMQNNDSVLIIEDAEPALHKRGDSGRTSAVSNILNLTDGLLSDCLNISIVCTFNTTSKDIDEALLRKGRLMMNYNFSKLNVEKSRALLNKLGHNDVVVNAPMTLAEIYYYEKENNGGEKLKTRKIGFGNTHQLNE